MKKFWELFCPLVTALGFSTAGALQSASFNVPPPPSLSINRAPDGSAQVTYRGATNFQFLVRASTNWTNWTLLGSNVANGPAMTFNDTQATNRRGHFYRAVSLKSPFMYQGTFQVGENGKFLLFARTNNTATFLGLNTTRGRMELANGLSVSTNGSFCGTFIVGAPGCGLLTQTNTVSGNFTNAAHVAGNLKGAQKSNTGPYASAAGVYVGTYDGFDLGSIGSITVLICPDGTIGIYMINFATQVTNGQITTMGANGMLDLPLLRAHVQGTLNTLDNTITAEIHDSSEWPAIFFNLTRTEPLF